MQTLTFNPYSEEEAKELFLGDEFPFATTFTAFKTTSWFDMPNKILVYGIKGKIGPDWYDICYGDRAIIFADKKLANKVRKHFSSFLTR